MKNIIKVTGSIFDYWYDCDRSGWREIERYFTTEEKADEWIEAHKDFAYSFKGNKATDKYEMPTYKKEVVELDRID